MCITLDESCTDENGKYVEKPLTVRMVQWQPFCVKTPFDPKTPVCAACKKTNRTRSFCRERHKHKALPWCTVYVLLSALDQADPSTVVAGPSELVTIGEGGETDSKPSTPQKGVGMSEGDHADIKQPATTGTPVVAAASFDSANTTLPTSDESAEKKNIEDGGDDINDIAESRTFLAKVSATSSTIHWLELAEYDSGEAAPFSGVLPPEGQSGIPPSVPPNMDPGQAQYYYAAQHQQNLKTNQAYFYQMHQRGQQPPQFASHPPGPWAGGPYGQPPHGHGNPIQIMQSHPGPPGQPPRPLQHGQMGQMPIPPPQQQQQQQQQDEPQEQQQEGDIPTSPPVTAGEAAAQRRRNKKQQEAAAAGTPGAPGQPLAPQQQQWAMYQPMTYPAGIPPGFHSYPHAPLAPQHPDQAPAHAQFQQTRLPPEQEAPPHHEPQQQQDVEQQQQQEQPHEQQDQSAETEEERDSKRQRTE